MASTVTDTPGNRSRPSERARRPDAGLAQLVVANDDVEIAVAIQIEQANAIVAAIGRAKRLAAEQVFGQTFAGLAKVEKLDFVSMPLDRVVDQLVDLVVLDPAVRMKHEREDALLDHGRVERLCQSRTVCGLFGFCSFCAVQSLGATMGNSQHSRSMT